jgi:glycosyltransferase 2 family protein
MRKILLIFIFFAAAAIAILSFGELKHTWQTLKHAEVGFVALAIILLIGWTLNDASIYHSLYRVMNVRENFFHLILLSSASNFINVVAPSGGFGGIAVFVDDAGKRGQPRGLAAAVGALYLFLDYAAFMVILGLGWIIYFRRNDLKPGELTASIIMLGIVLGLGALIYIGSRSGEQLGRVLAWLSHRINAILWPMIRREYFREIAAREFGVEVAEGLSILHAKHHRIVMPFLISLIGKLLQTIILGVTFLAFDVPFSTSTIIVGFSSAYLFLTVSPTPHGIGIVEAILPFTLASQGVEWEDAVIITLAYRGVTFWLPLFLGGISFQALQRE